MSDMPIGYIRVPAGTYEFLREVAEREHLSMARVAARLLAHAAEQGWTVRDAGVVVEQS